MTSLVTFTSAPGGAVGCVNLRHRRSSTTPLKEQIASETPGERAARLQRLRARQRIHGIASETPGEREQLVYNS